MFAIRIKEESPFTPNIPVPIEYFTARNEEIEKIRRQIRGALHFQRIENIFITGDRGIGKTSLAKYIRNIASKEFGLFGLHTNLKGVSNLEDMVRILFQDLFKEQDVDKSLIEKFKSIFNDYIKGVNIFGLGVEFTDDRGKLRSLVDNLIPALYGIYNQIKENKSGILLILDDLNGIASVPEFAHYIKSFVDTIATRDYKIPLVLILVGYDEKRLEMIKNNPSTARIFNIINLEPMTKSESEEFFTRTFTSHNITVEEKAMEALIMASGGYPMLMHEVGEAIFWEDTDNIIDKKDFAGFDSAARKVGEKILGIQYKTLNSEKYRSIFVKLGLIQKTEFKRQDLLEILTDTEKSVLDNFLNKIKKIGFIVQTEVRGEYRYANVLYKNYAHMESAHHLAGILSS
jgi:AAA+ ATPase superfamily predicted ATPase